MNSIDYTEPAEAGANAGTGPSEPPPHQLTEARGFPGHPSPPELTRARLEGSPAPPGLRGSLAPAGRAGSGCPEVYSEGSTGSTGVSSSGSGVLLAPDPGVDGPFGSTGPLGPGGTGGPGATCSTLGSGSTGTTGAPGPLVVPVLALPDSLNLDQNRRVCCEGLGELALADFLAWELDPFWMLTVRPPDTWAVEKIQQAVIEAAKRYRRKTRAKRALVDDDLVYYAAILYCHEWKLWHVHILCQRLPAHSRTLTRCFKAEFGSRYGVVDLQDRTDLREEAAERSGWLQEIHEAVDYRTYVAGRRNIVGHYGYDEEQALDYHVDLHSPLLKRHPKRERPDVKARPEPLIEPGRRGTGWSRITASHAAPPPPGSQELAVLRLVESEAYFRSRSAWPHPRIARTLRDDLGRIYRWDGTCSLPVYLHGRGKPGRYPLIEDVPLALRATVGRVWHNRTISISRAYIRLDQQPEETKWAYVEEFGIAPNELGLEPEQTG